MSTVKIAILMPFYGSFTHFREAIESVRGQDGSNWHLIVIDDFYPDPEPGMWLVGLGDTRITYLRNQTNLGVSGNFRRAAGLATGDYAVIMGCDDVMLPGFVSRLTALAEQFPSATMIQTGVRVINGAGDAALPLADRVKALQRIRGAHPALVGGERLAASLLAGNWTYFPSLAWRVEALRKYEFRQDFDVVLDLALQLEIILNGGVMLIDDEINFLYRRHRSSVSSWKAEDGTRFVQEKELFRESAERLRSIGWNRAARSAELHLTSRLNAVTQLPRALRARERSQRQLLVEHIFGKTRRSQR